jgi:REP element-mobilizing transposase RayT
MEIRNRVGLPEMWFHVMNRGAMRNDIFLDDEDRSYFVGLMGKLAKGYEVKICAWCLMPNHFHIQLFSDGTTLCDFMRDLDGAYARAFNDRHGGSGRLFQGNFKSTVPRTDEGVAYVNRYIHANPRDLDIRPENYRWSSCRSYLGLAPVPTWLDPERVLAITRKEGMSDADAYRAYLDAVPPKIKKGEAEDDPCLDFDLEFIRHLEDQYTRVLGGMAAVTRHLLPRTVVCWAAMTRHRIPARTLAAYYGYQSRQTVHTIVERFRRWLESNPDAASILKKC